MNKKQLFILAAAIFVFSVTGSQARTETPEEVVKILAVLKAEKCKNTRDSMGEKKLFMEGNKFVVEAACADGKSYTFNLDQNFKILGKKVHKN